MTERNALIRELRGQGWKVLALAYRFQVTPQWIWQILKRERERAAA